jgi:hypothetical protein
VVLESRRNCQYVTPAHGSRGEEGCWDKIATVYLGRLRYGILCVDHSIIFGGLECVSHSFAYVVHFVFLRDVWIRTQRAM